MIFPVPFSTNVANDIVLFKALFFFFKTHDLMHRRSCIDGKKKSIVNPRRTKANHPMMLPLSGHRDVQTLVEPLDKL